MKRIIAEHLERVEGHGGVEINIDDGKVKEVRFFVNEGPRFFERIVIGKSPPEVLSLVSRICAICSISHRYAAIRALENAFSIEIESIALFLRELMHLGEIIESNSLHVFMLAMPDLYGFPSIIAMKEQYKKEALTGLKLKSFGNEVMQIITGRAIHGENPIVGGFGKYPAMNELMQIKSKAIDLLPAAIDVANSLGTIKHLDFPESDALFVALSPSQEDYGFVGNEIISSDGQRISVQDYKNFIAEFIVEHSFAKHSVNKDKPYTVGALARINLFGERLKGEAGNLYQKYYKHAWRYNPFFNIPAQMIEIVYSLERIINIISQIEDYEKVADEIKSSIKYLDSCAAGAVEAPRGTLIHYYEIKNGEIIDADIITPTAQNAGDIERYCYLFAQYLLDNNLANDIEISIRKLVRAFDPCISCSVH